MRISKILLLALFLPATVTLSAQVAINTNGTPAEQSSMLDVTSTTKGILIPRMSAAQRDAISSPANGLMVFVTDDQCFYYYNGTQWDKILNNNTNDDDWIISGNTVYVPPAKKVGIGTYSPDALLTVVNISSSDKPVKIANSYSGSETVYGMYSSLLGNSTGNQYGDYYSVQNGGNGTHYGSYAYMSGSGDGYQYGFCSNMFNAGNGKHYGVFTSLNGSGNGEQYGVYNNIINSGTESKYGTYNMFNSSSSANMYGTYNKITASGTGNHYGMYNYISGTGSGDKYGLFTDFSSTAGGKHYGVYINAPGEENYAAMLHGKTYIKDNTSGITVPDNALTTIDASDSDTTLYVVNTPNSGQITYGVISNIKGSDNGEKHALYNIIENTGNGAHVGVYNKITGNAIGYQYGVYNNIDNTGTYPHFGSYSTLSGTGTGTHYGNYAVLSGSGNGDKIGSFVEILSSTGGVHYGYKCDVAGSSNWAGYFDGRMYVSDNVGIGVPSPTVKLDVDGDVQFKNTSSDALVDIESTSGAATINIKAAGSSDLAQVKFYNGSVEKALFGYDEANNRIFIKEGIKNVFIDNGNINPEVHKQQNLGYNGKAWNNIYYDDLYNQGAAAFVNRTVSKELVNFPPKEKMSGSFDDKTDRGEAELEPASLPPGLHDDNAILTDEVVTYNYKANYEQQLLLNKQADKIAELEKRLESQSKIIEQLLQKLSGK